MTELIVTTGLMEAMKSMMEASLGSAGLIVNGTGKSSGG